MSHYTVLVIGDDVEGSLAPFHEFECTGHDDEFVQDVSQLEEAIKEYSEYTRTVYVDPEGKYHARYNDEFYRELTPEEEKENHGWSWCGNGKSWTSKDWGDGKGYRAKMQFIPEWFVEKEVPISELETFREWASDYYGKKIINESEIPDLSGDHKYGYMRVGKNGEVIEMIDRTNPNSHWDWYQIGGRWAWGITVKPGTTFDTPNFSWGWNAEEKAKMIQTLRTDSAMIKDIDFDAMTAASIQDYTERYAILSNWDNTPAEERFGRFFWANDEIEFVKAGHSLQEYIDEFIPHPLSAYAYIYENEWYARGEMGWWACSDDKFTASEWKKEFTKFISTLDPETRITFVDCHT